jgi:putative DNA primase/helicase
MKAILNETDKILDTLNDNVIDHPLKYYTYNAQGQLKFNHHMVKDEILAEQPIYRSDIGVLRYENGFYKRSTNGDILHIIQERIGEEATQARKREILDLILHENKAIPLSEFNKGGGLLKFLNVKNGIYNIRSKRLERHNPFYYWTIQQPVKYDPEAKCPAILEFLHDILDNDGVQFIIEYLAYMCLPYTDTDKILFLHGSGGNGKGTLINIIQHFLGDNNITNMSLRDLSEDKFSRAHLYGKLANICGDIDNHVLNNTGIIKSLTGDDTVYAQFKGVDGFNFKNYAKLLFTANELPMSTDKTHGYFRRIFILPFEKQLPEEKKIARAVMDKRLTAPSELSGLLNLVIEAIHRLEANDFKFTVPVSAQKALEQYKYAHDKIEQFMTEEGTKEALAKVTLKHFYSAYVDWCKENGILPEQKRKVKDKLEEKGLRIEKGSGNKDFVFGFKFNKNSTYSIDEK